MTGSISVGFKSRSQNEEPQGEVKTDSMQQEAKIGMMVEVQASRPKGTGLPAWKRALDIGFVLLLIPGMVLIGSIVALIIKLGSPGPVFFCQKRVGWKGREFRLLKFRTMKVDADTELHRKHAQQLIHSKRPMTKLDDGNDPRLIPFGGVLRTLGLDELPQLINVMRGEMSLVGPRPCLPYEYEAYEPWQRRRFNAVPGLTGLWQVSGKNRTTFERMIQLDIAYFETQSLWLDLAIIAKTIPALGRQWQDQRAAKRGSTENTSVQVGKTVHQVQL
jgi:exopolysaccharide production protein ExoY